MSALPEGTLGAFCEHAGRERIAGKKGGPLTGLSFAVKDLIDVAGIRTGGGNPDWLKDQAPAPKHAFAVQRALDAGGVFVGKTVTDELAFSLTGRNVHYGTPVNPSAPDRTPGGSSSGSASVVAAGIVDFALGTDTGGSVRIPASYCGLFGIRPTHNRISLDGVVRFAPSFDTVGWLARDAQMLRKVGSALLPGYVDQRFPAKVIRADDAFARADADTRARCDALFEKLSALTGARGNATVCPTSLEAWMYTFRTLRSVEVWRNKGPWIEREHPNFGPEIARNFAAAARTKQGDAEKEQPVRDDIVEHLKSLLRGDAVIALPTAPGPAPLRGASDAELDRVRDQTQALTCIAGLGGLPQISVPAGLVEGAPVGLSLIGGPNADEQLLEVAVRLSEAR